ncbi:MAG: hypothetical protein ACRDPC_26865 [Solirubrobacteraceae bacterium]
MSRRTVVWVAALVALVIAPAAAPAPAPERVKGAIVVIAGNIDSQLLRQAGVTHVAVELTDDNLRDFATPRWDGFVRGGFHVARDTTQESIRATARKTASLISGHRLEFLIEDTEAHKADLPDGVLKPERLRWTEWLFSELRSQLGPSFPLYNVTVGVDSSPEVVNHEALRRHNIIPIWEAYDANGVTLGVGRTAAKAADEGWSAPQIAIGDKSLATDLPQTKTQALAGVWLWAPDNGSLATQPPATSGTAPPDDSQPPGPGIQVGPPLDADQGSDTPGGEVEVGKDSKPRWWDLPGRVRYGITSWFRGLVEDALNPMLELIGKTVLATPQIAGQDRVGDLWLISLGIADGLLILFVLAGAALVMTHETLHTRYALKEMLPRIALAAILVNASLSLSGHMIAAANALSGGFLAGGVDPGEASLQLKHFILAAVAGSGIFVILLGLVAAALCVFLFILYVVRAALILILVAGAPLMLLTHALPQTDGLARLWWRGMTAALGVQVAQALVLATAVRVFFSSGGREALGLSVTGNLIDLLVSLCLFWILIKIPFWAKDLAFSPGRSSVVQIARSYALGRGLRALP